MFISVLWNTLHVKNPIKYKKKFKHKNEISLDQKLNIILIIGAVLTRNKYLTFYDVVIYNFYGFNGEFN